MKAKVLEFEQSEARPVGVEEPGCGPRFLRVQLEGERRFLQTSQRSAARLPPDIQATALRKLRLLNNPRRLDDLRVPPANRLEALKGERRGQRSIRINDQWRFIWSDNNAHPVEIVDYH